MHYKTSNSASQVSMKTTKPNQEQMTKTSEYLLRVIITCYGWIEENRSLIEEHADNNTYQYLKNDP